MFPAVLFLILSIVSGTRWKSVHAVVLAAGAFFLTTPTDASEASSAKHSLEIKDYQKARESYRKLAGEAKLREVRARYRLGEGTAAYRAGEFREARGAFSQSLLSVDPEVQASGHLGMGNSLFQLGWKSLSNEAYPTDPASIPDIARFDTIVKEALAKLRESDAPDEGDTSGFVKMEALITNWADSIRHYDSALALSPQDKAARNNRGMTMVYLKRLRELLKQEEEETAQSMPQPQPGPGEPQEGEGDGEGEPQEGDGKGEEKPGEEGNGDKEPKDGSGDEGDKDKDGKKDKDKDKDKKDGDKDGENPNESPQERAHRILKENADLEKGPLSPGRREFRDPQKDW
jgi:Ca-activated chloride channel homolog